MTDMTDKIMSCERNNIKCHKLLSGKCLFCRVNRVNIGTIILGRTISRNLHANRCAAVGVIRIPLRGAALAVGMQPTLPSPIWTCGQILLHLLDQGQYFGVGRALGQCLLCMSSLCCDSHHSHEAESKCWIISVMVIKMAKKNYQTSWCERPLLTDKLVALIT